jgi:hypothetical protein
MAYEIRHCHYRHLDPAQHPEPAIFTVYRSGALVAVVREPADAPLIGEPVPLKNYRVDCREAPDELRATLGRYFPGRAFEYFVDPAWAWRHNGTYEEMPWRAGPSPAT